MRPHRHPRALGQSLVEFALVLTPLLFVLVGFIDVARAIYVWNSLSEAARIGVRYAMVHGSDAGASAEGQAGSVSFPCSTTLVNIVRARVPNPNPADVTVTCSWPTAQNTPSNPVRVEASIPFTPMFGQFFLGRTITLRAGAEMVIVY